MVDQKVDLIRELHEANNIPDDHSVLDNPNNIFSYFARMSDNEGQRLTALRRATQFKGVLKNQLLSWIDDTLRVITEDTFKLDHDFDLLIDDEFVHILRPSGFESIGKLKQVILDAVPENIQKISNDMSFVEWGAIQQYAKEHTRAARYLSAIATFRRSANVDKDKLLFHCSEMNVEVVESDGKVVVNEKYIMDFIKIIDRRLFSIDISTGGSEGFDAPNRQKR